MNKHWPSTPLGEILIERKETPSAHSIEIGETRIVSKIVFDTGKIEFRTGTQTKTKMIVIQPGDLVLSGINAAKGAIAIYQDSETLQVAATIHYGAYEVNGDKADKGYLWWLLRSNAFREILDRNLPGGIKTELKAKRLLPIEIPLPPISEQHRIVAKIHRMANKVEEARKLRQSAQKALTAMGNSLLWGYFEPTPGEDESLMALENACEAIIDCLHSNPIYSETGIPTVRSPDVGWGHLFLAGAKKTDETEYIRRTKRAEPKPGDIILVREGGGTGKAGIVENGQKLSLGQRVMQITPNRNMLESQFFLYQWLSPKIQSEQIEPKLKGSASPHLNIKDIRRFILWVPSLSKQREVISKIESSFAFIESLKSLQTKTAVELDAMLPSILDRAFKGEL